MVHDPNSWAGKGRFGTFTRTIGKMGTLGLLMLLHVVVICGLLAAHALHAKLLPLAAPTLGAVVGDTVALVSAPKALLSGRQFEEYVQSGLVDLRIMLVQAARRRRDG